MVSSTKMLTTTLLLMMTQKTESCLNAFTIERIIRYENLKDEINKQRADTKAKEEQKQDFAELLPEEHDGTCSSHNTRKGGHQPEAVTWSPVQWKHPRTAVWVQARLQLVRVSLC